MVAAWRLSSSNIDTETYTAELNGDEEKCSKFSTFIMLFT